MGHPLIFESRELNQKSDNQGELSVIFIKYLTLSFEVIIFEKSKETTFSGSKTICSGVVPLLGVWGLCIGMGDPNGDPDCVGSGWGHRSGDVWKATALRTNSTKRVGKCLLKLEPNLRVQEAPGSNPGTPTTGPRVSLGIRGFSLAFHHFFGELNFWRFGLTQTRPIREKFQGVPGWLARYSLLISVLSCAAFKLPGL